MGILLSSTIAVWVINSQLFVHDLVRGDIKKISSEALCIVDTTSLIGFVWTDDEEICSDYEEKGYAIFYNTR